MGVRHDWSRRSLIMTTTAEPENPQERPCSISSRFASPISFCLLQFQLSQSTDWLDLGRSILIYFQCRLPVISVVEGLKEGLEWVSLRCSVTFVLGLYSSSPKGRISTSSLKLMEGRFTRSGTHRRQMHALCNSNGVVHSRPPSGHPVW